MQCKLRKASLDIDFLANCVKHNLTPKFIQFKVTNRGLRGSNVYKQCQTKLLNQELENKRKHLQQLNRQFNQIKEQIRITVSVLDFLHISNLFLVKNDRILNIVRLTQEKKLFNLGLREASEANDPEKVIFNLSSRNLNASEKELLAKV